MTINGYEVFVFDNTGTKNESADRYTIILAENGDLSYCGVHPFAPQGIGGHGNNIVDKKLGNHWEDWCKQRKKTIKQAVTEWLSTARNDTDWLGNEVTDKSKLPEDVLKFIIQDLTFEKDYVWRQVFPKLDISRGAPMGRTNVGINPIETKEFKATRDKMLSLRTKFDRATTVTNKEVLKELGLVLHDRKIPMATDSAYDSNGAYWGLHPEYKQLRIRYLKNLTYIEFYWK